MSAIFNKAMSLLRTIESFGDYKAYIVGGALRDLYRNEGHNIKDVDISTNCPTDVLSAKLTTFELGRSAEFGIIGVRFEGEFFEVAQFRSDGEYKNGRRPSYVTLVDDCREDLKRRDFTINALAMGTDCQIIDIVGGIPDIQDRIIRAIGKPEDRFQEDYLRMVRAARFGSLEGFTIEKLTRRAIRRFSHMVKKVTPERITIEFRKAAMGPGKSFAKFILLLDDLKLLSKILPEIHALKYFRQDLNHHPEGPTVFDHTIKCLECVGQISWKSNIAILFHDVGKAVSFQEDKYGWKLTYHDHASVGAKMTHYILSKRFYLNNADTRDIVYAVENHMKFHKILEMKPAKIARMVSHPAFDTLSHVAWADEYSRGEKFAHYGTFSEKLQKAVEIKDKWENRIVNPSNKIVDGNRIIELTGLEPSRIVGEIKEAVENRIMDEELDPSNPGLVDFLILEEKTKLEEKYDV